MHKPFSFSDQVGIRENVFEGLIVCKCLFVCFFFFFFFFLFLFSDSYKVEAHKRRRSTFRAKFSTFKKENHTFTSSFKEEFTKYGS
jgi:hypothetical protein